MSWQPVRWTLVTALLSVSAAAQENRGRRAIRPLDDPPVIAADADAMAAKKTLLAGIPPTETDATRTPNVVLILADDLGYGDTAVYGSKEIPTPHIDSHAADGVRFTDAYVTAASCSPSRAGLITGRYQQRFGFEFNTSGAAVTHRTGRGLEPSAVTLAEVFQAAGYATAMYGKWHLGTRDYFHPLERGFDDFFGFLAGAHSFLPVKEPQPIFSTVMRGRKPLVESEYLTDAFARETERFIADHRGDPFFVYVPFNAVHTPLEATDTYLQRFASEPNRRKRAYMAMTSALDDAVGRIRAALRKADVEKNTVVVFLNDNGGPIYTQVQSNGPLRLGKLFLFEGGIRVPMIVSWPGVIDRESVYREPVSSLDLFPTLSAAAGVKLPAELPLDGVNLLPYLSGQRVGPPHEALYWSNGPNRAIRMGDWKMIACGEHRFLFNLEQDIGEQRNIASERPDKLKQLERKLRAWQDEMKPPAWPSKPNRRTVEIDGIPYEIHI